MNIKMHIICKIWSCAKKSKFKPNVTNQRWKSHIRSFCAFSAYSNWSHDVFRARL